MLLQSQTNNQNMKSYDAKIDDSKYSPMKSVFNRTGYKVTTKIASTLQGSVYNAIHCNGSQCVLKRTSVRLHKMGIACVDNKVYHVSENIINEAKIMKHLSKMKPPKKGLPKFIDFFSDNKNYFLLMENGGKSLLKHVIDFHLKINRGILKLKVWKKHVKILFKQMCVFINWLHNTAKMVHLEISLENMLIHGCVFENGKFISHGQINFIDFGVGMSYINKRSFDNCTKYVGKPNYQAPKVYHQIPFNAAKADIWCLGIVLFMMIIGACPYQKPTKSDKMFMNIYHGYIEKWLNDSGKTKYISKHLLDLFSHIFCDEKDRWLIQKIIKHPYI